MKSIKYFAIACLFVGAMNMQAMDNDTHLVAAAAASALTSAAQRAEDERQSLWEKDRDLFHTACDWPDLDWIYGIDYRIYDKNGNPVSVATERTPQEKDRDIREVQCGNVTFRHPGPLNSYIVTAKLHATLKLKEEAIEKKKKERKDIIERRKRELEEARKREEDRKKNGGREQHYGSYCS